MGAQRGYGLPVLLLYGATWSPMYPALQTMIAGLNPEPETQRRAFAINFTTQNAALGLGSTVGAIVARVHHPGTFQALFLANAASCLLFAVALPFLPSLHRPRGADEPRVGYRDVLAGRSLRLMLVASLLIYFHRFPAFDQGRHRCPPEPHSYHPARSAERPLAVAPARLSATGPEGGVRHSV